MESPDESNYDKPENENISMCLIPFDPPQSVRYYSADVKPLKRKFRPSTLNPYAPFFSSTYIEKELDCTITWDDETLPCAVDDDDDDRVSKSKSKSVKLRKTRRSESKSANLSESSDSDYESDKKNDSRTVSRKPAKKSSPRSKSQISDESDENIGETKTRKTTKK